ncbi:MAG: hypothetical protein MHPSP_000514 [Paramarteilia canceri]
MIPVYRRLINYLLTDLAVQASVGTFSALKLRSEKYFDLTGLATFNTLATASLFIPASKLQAKSPLLSRVNQRKFLATWAVFIWSTRLAKQQFQRALNSNDGRFDSIRNNPIKFLFTWFVQAVWVGATLTPVLLLNFSQPKNIKTLYDAPAIFLFMAGFALEAMADLQKDGFKKNPANKGKFIDVGVWKYIEFPNYAGEILLWSGLSMYCWPVVSKIGKFGKFSCFLSPLYTFTMLTFLSGVPLQRKQANDRWATDPAYSVHRSQIGMYWPKFW